MKLKELKKMISEEYAKYMKEQDMPAVAVSDKDVDADGSEDAEATLKDIYEMLKDFFEGGAEDDDAMDEGMGMYDEDEKDMKKEGKKDDDDKMEEGKDDDDKKEESKNLQERFQKLANIIK